MNHFTVFSMLLFSFAPLYAAEDPTSIIRTFMEALYSNDQAAYEKTIFPHAESSRLVGKQQLTAEQLQEVKTDVAAMELSQVQPYTHAGETIQSTNYPVGTTATFMTHFRGVTLAIPIEKSEDGWKVDVRFWLVSEREYSESDPEIIIKKFMYFLIQHNADELAKITTPGYDFSKIFGSSKPSREDQYYALAAEMPVVLARNGESMKLANNKLIQANSSQKNERWYIGMYGADKLVFKLVRSGKSWVIEPYDYLTHIGLGVQKSPD